MTSTAAVRAERLALTARIRAIIVKALDLDIDPSWVDDDQPLFGRGLELDSLDAIELVVALEDELLVELDPEDPRLLGSVNSIADAVEARLCGDNGA